MSLNEYHMNLITMMEGNEEGDKTIEYFGNLIKENEELKKRDEEARKLFEESNEKMMERIKTEEDKVKKIDQELDVYKEADTQMTTQIEDLEDEKEELELVILYDDNRRVNRTWHFPLQNNQFVIFPSVQKFYINESKSSKLQTLLVSTYEYI